MKYIKPPNMYPYNQKDMKGFTVVELVLALLISALIIASVYAAYTSQQHTQTTQSQLVELQQNLRATMNFLTTELRMAGFDTSNNRAAGAGIVTATTGTLRYNWDKDGNGQMITPGGDGEDDENIEYGFSADANNDGDPDDDTAYFGRTSFGVGMARNIQEVSANIDRVEFLYILEDTSDNNVYDPFKTTNPTAAQLDDIRAVTITLLARTASADLQYTDSKTYTAGSGTVWPKYNDNFRRRLLITTVKLRNLGL